MGKKKSKDGWLEWLAYLLIVIGAVNWGLVGVVNANLVTALFGSGLATKITYVLVSISGLYVAYLKWMK